MKKVLYWLAGIAFVGLLVFLGVKNNAKPSKKGESGKGKSAIGVDGYVLKTSSLADEIVVTGSLIAYESVELKSETAGRVVQLNLPEGKPVKEGALLVKLYDDDLQANLKKLESQFALQKQIYKRQSELLKINGISQTDFDQTALQLNAISAEIEVQKVMIRKTEVRAPFNGVIGLRQISLGAQILPSTTLAVLRKEDQLKLDFSVPEKYSSLMKEGMKVKFSLYNSEESYPAKVIATEREIDNNTRNLKVRAVVESKSKALIPGAFIRVKLFFGLNEKALLIPSGAIIPKEREKRIILSKGGKAHFVSIRTGVRSASSVEVTEGVAAGDTVVTSGILFLKEGDALRFTTVNSDAL